MSNVIGIRQARPLAMRAAGSVMLVAIGLAVGLAVGHGPGGAPSLSIRSVHASNVRVADAAYLSYRAGERADLVAAPGVESAAAYESYRSGERASLAAAPDAAYRAYRVGERAALPRLR